MTEAYTEIGYSKVSIKQKVDNFRVDIEETIKKKICRLTIHLSELQLAYIGLQTNNQL